MPRPTVSDDKKLVRLPVTFNRLFQQSLFIVMAPCNCAVPGCFTSYKKGEKVYLKQIKSLTFLKKDSPEYKHQELLQQFILRYRDGKSKEDAILARIHRGQCDICDKHFTTADFDIRKF